MFFCESIVHTSTTRRPHKKDIWIIVLLDEFFSFIMTENLQVLLSKGLIFDLKIW